MQFIVLQALEQHLLHHFLATDLTHINILCELYMDQGHYEQARALVERAEMVFCGGGALPLDLAVKLGVCICNVAKMEAQFEVRGLG